MSYVQTVLNAVTLPAMPDMKLAMQRRQAEAEHARREVMRAASVGDRPCCS